jgi:membrane dipeptidase
MRRGLSRRAFLGTAAGGTLAAGACVAGGGTARRGLVFDAAVPLASPATGFEAFQIELEARRAAGFDLVMVPVAVRDGIEATLRSLLALQSHAGRMPDEAVLVRSSADLERVRPGIGVVAQIQGLHMLGEQLSLIAELRRAGITVMQLTGPWKNWCADGCFERGDLPLTGLGRMAVRAIADARVVLDLAQAGRRSGLEALELTEGPVIVSRANAAGVYDHPQNLTDAQIDAVRQRGGVICASPFPPLLSAAERPTIDDLVRHIDHIVERTGIEHVGIGLDFDDRPRRRFADDPLPDPPYAWPEGLASAADIDALRQRLAREGWTTAQLQQLLGDNLVRVLDGALGPGTG